MGGMTARFMEFRKKEIINVKNGMKIGYVDDILFNTERAVIESIVVYGRLRFFGLFGREDDLLIPWEDIEIVGEDTILVKNDGAGESHRQGRTGYLDRLFG